MSVRYRPFQACAHYAWHLTVVATELYLYSTLCNINIVTLLPNAWQTKLMLKIIRRKQSKTVLLHKGKERDT